MTVPSRRYGTGMRQSPMQAVDFVIQTILVMGFLIPGLTFSFSIFFFFSFLFFSLNKGISALAGFREAQRREKQVSARSGEKKKRMLLTFPVREGVKPFCYELFIIKGKCHQHPCCHATKPHFRPFPHRSEILALLQEQGCMWAALHCLSTPGCLCPLGQGDSPGVLLRDVLAFKAMKTCDSRWMCCSSTLTWIAPV